MDPHSRWILLLTAQFSSRAGGAGGRTGPLMNTTHGRAAKVHPLLLLKSKQKKKNPPDFDLYRHWECFGKVNFSFPAAGLVMVSSFGMASDTGSAFPCQRAAQFINYSVLIINNMQAPGCKSSQPP